VPGASPPSDRAIARRTAEEAAREREERYRALFEAMDEGFCTLEILVDGDGVPSDYRFLEVNPAFERQTGLRDVVGHRAREVVPDLEAAWVDTYGRVARTGDPVRFTNHAASMGRWFEAYAFRIGPPDALQVAVVFNDVTARKQAEEEREELLERERMGRTAAEAFLAVMSHELRTPVTSIYGRATLLARNPDRPDRGDLVEDMLDEAEQLRRIIDDLLVLSGIDRGHLPLTSEPVLIQRAVAEVLVDARRRFPQVTFETRMSPGVPPVTGDSTALRQVLYNLVSNAAKYAGMDGPVTITATDLGDTIEVQILDEGPGVGDNPAALFDLFYRAPHTAKRASGTGIGLYVASELLRAMEATIEASTRPTGGASFRLGLKPALED
jgi:PAS domain S-box-containing protein